MDSFVIPITRRRASAGLALIACVPLACEAQAGPPRIAFLATGSETRGARLKAYFQSVAQAEGLVEGKDYAVDFYWAEGRYDRFPALARAAVGRKPALLLVTTIASAKAAQQATRTIPIVMTGLNLPVETGLVASLARPGGNITGVATMSDVIVGKLLELTREIIPGVKRVALLMNPQNSSNLPIFQDLDRLARSAGISAIAVDIASPEQITPALAELASKRPDALFTGFDSSLADHRWRFAAFSESESIPIVSTDGVYTESGAVVTYSAQGALFKMTLVYVQKILAGAKPADLPVQRPTSFELVVNTRVAKALKIKLPQALLSRADKLIE